LFPGEFDMPDPSVLRRNGLTGTRRSVIRSLIAALALATAPHALAAGLAFPEGMSAPAKPAVMPAFELPTTSGKALNSASLKGQVVIIRFWASW